METFKFVTILLLYYEYTVYCYPSIPQAAHYVPPIRKLKRKINPLNYVDVTAAQLSASGPLHLNIPLPLVIDNENSEKETITESPNEIEKKIISCHEKATTDDQNTRGILLKKLSSYYPSVPLNEKSPGSVWLLLNDKNQQTNSDEALQKKIIPKCVLCVAPTFNPCDEGYVYDKRGRCNKVIEPNEEALSEFHSNKLKEKFGPIDYEDDTVEKLSLPGSYWLEIPLKNENKDSQKDTVFNRIVSLVKTIFGKREIDLEVKNVHDENSREIVEITTKKNHDATTVPESSATLLGSEEISIVATVTEILTTTESAVDITTDSQNAKSVTTDLDALSSTEELPSFTTVLTTPPYREMNIQVTQVKSSSPTLFRFPDHAKVQTPLFSPAFKLPDGDFSLQTQTPPSVEETTITRDDNKHFPEFNFPSLVDNPDNDGKMVYSKVANLSYSSGVQRQFTPITNHLKFNRRGRHKTENIVLPPSVELVQV